MTSTTSGGGGKVASWLDDQLRGYNPKLTVGISKSRFWKMMFLLKEMILRFDFLVFEGAVPTLFSWPVNSDTSFSMFAFKMRETWVSLGWRT